MRGFALPLATLVVLTVRGKQIAAQSQRDSVTAQSRGPSLGLSAEATYMTTIVSAQPGAGGRLTEGSLTRSVVSAHASLREKRVSAQVELNLEGLTLPRGELNPGIFGEGYYDRRHPHTFFHDVVATARTAVGRTSPFSASISTGRGFAPFGTDDPMSRPFTKFPANHHLSQLLERIIVIGAIERAIGRASAITLELGTFNGDDPIGPFAAPALRRFGDSWSGRATLSSRTPEKDLEVQVSHASVRSPDIVAGGGLDQKKRSGSLRAEFPSRRWKPYGLIEYAATGAYDKGLRAFAYTTWLAEASVRPEDFELGVRFERTDRPEEGRTINSFRSPRPPHDLSNLGITRWHIVSGRLARTYARALSVTLFAEGSIANATRLIPNSVFDPNLFYGTSHMWTVATGLRLAVGITRHARMGRYGIAESGVASAVSDHRHR